MNNEPLNTSNTNQSHDKRFEEYTNNNQSIPNSWIEADNKAQESIMDKFLSSVTGNYVQSSLFPGEKVLYWGRVSWFSQSRNIIFCIFIFPLFAAVINVLSTELALTNKRIIAKFGFIRRETIDLSLNRIESIGIHQSFLGRILNYGTVVINGTGGLRSSVPYISRPFEFRQQVGRQVTQ